MSDKIIYGITGLFDKPDDIIHAAEATVASGYKKFDIHTPYPVHGMDGAMKLKPSTMGYFALTLGLTGTISALLLMYWVMAMEYPINIGGKPFFSLPAFVPVMFEITVLMATIGSVLSMLFIFFKMPNNSHPLHDTDYMKAVTSTQFGLCLEAKDPKFDEAKAKEFMIQLGASNITSIYYDNNEINHVHRIFDPKFLAFIVFVAVLTSTVTYFGWNKLAFTAPFNWMEYQFKVSAQSNKSFFKDGFSARTPVEGSVARGFMPYLYKDNPQDAEKYLTNPLPATREVIAKGKKRFDTFCSPCHGYTGQSESRLGLNFPMPPSLHSEKARKWSDGMFYHIIMQGQVSMPSYAKQISPDDRWAVIHYIRTLQRALNAKEGDLK